MINKIRTTIAVAGGVIVALIAILLLVVPYALAFVFWLVVPRDMRVETFYPRDFIHMILEPFE